MKLKLSSGGIKVDMCPPAFFVRAVKVGKKIRVIISSGITLDLTPREARMLKNRLDWELNQ